MLGIWEYFWNVLDWVPIVAAPKNLCQVTATVSEVTTAIATTAQLHTITGKV